MAEIIAPNGSPLSVAVISVKNLDDSLHFYRDIIGLTGEPAQEYFGEKFEQLWNLPAGSTAKAAFCELEGCPVGRLLLLEFNAHVKEEVRLKHVKRAFGLVNLNFYTDNIVADTKMLREYGFDFWSEPTFYEMTNSQGAPTEVVFDGPDSVAINLVELTDKDPKTRVGQMRAYVQKYGRTTSGFTPVVTSSHVVKDINRAIEFYEKVLQNGILIDEVLGSPEQNKFLNLPVESKTSVKFIQGNHMFGKIALSMPLNYECDDLVSRAHAPNIGYLAQMFEVSDIETAHNMCTELELDLYAPKQTYQIPGLGLVQAFTVENPGSKALQIIFQV